MTDSEHLKLIFILCSICMRQDVAELKLFVKVNARYVDTNDFNKILRKSMKIMELKRCGNSSCPDWLMNELFQLYKTEETSI
jgi:hypothetical protein